ncbi:MAG TPA: hypothetical protein VH114_02510, partial [Candidatus Acidoferrum sp.]|nr:hypothetical protein [Candidatus Acidoferrum sp.]
MKRGLLLALLLLFNYGSPAFAQAPATASTSPSFDPASFTAEIRSLEAALKEKSSPNELAAFRDSLPPGWTVATPERTYSISSEPLRNQLASQSRDKALAWMDRLTAELESYSAVRAENS